MEHSLQSYFKLQVVWAEKQRYFPKKLADKMSRKTDQRYSGGKMKGGTFIFSNEGTTQGDGHLRILIHKFPSYNGGAMLHRMQPAMVR